MMQTDMQEDSDPLMLVAGTHAYRPPSGTVETIPAVEMGKGGDRILCATLFRPKVSPVNPMPAIVFIHGGGWNSGSRHNFFGAWLAEKGYFVANIEYRLTTEAAWPAQIQDCKLGIRWLRASAAKYHVDPDRIGVWGKSAGGQLAACLGTMQDVPELEGEGFEGVSSRVQAVADFCGPSDFTDDWEEGHPMPDFVVALFGVPREEKPELWKQGSPAHHVKTGTPPFFIAHSEDDRTVPFSESEKLVKALMDCGNSVEWMPIKNGAHGFSSNPTTPQSSMEPDHEVIMAGLLAFFDKHLRENS